MRLGNSVRRLRIGLIMMTVVMVIFTGRLVQLQVVSDAKYAAAAEQQRLEKVTLPATRGDIATRNGATLATTVKRKTIFADPALVQRLEDAHKAATQLAPLLEMPVAEVEEQLRTPDDRYVVLRQTVEPALARRIMELDIDGIGTKPERQRVYPSGKLAANIIGFVGSDGVGAVGLEYGMNDVLAGKDGKKIVEIGRRGQAIPSASDFRRPPQPGRDVRLTIDRDLQWKAQQAIAKQVRKTKAQRGSVIVMDPETGEILALAVAPTFNPAQPAETPSKYWNNPPLQHVFEPGSTAKVITMAAALEGSYTPATKVTVPPVLRAYGETIHDAHAHGTVHMSLAGVLAKSSNIGTALVAQQVGAKRLYHAMRDFGLDRPLDIGFPGATDGKVPPPEEWDGINQYTIPFGQGISVNAVQMASVYATIANGGVRVSPSLVAGTQGAEGEFEPAPEPERRRVVSKKTAHQLTRMLELAASERGTGANAQIQGYRIAGKTGTAQRVDPDCGCYRGYNAMFSGFAPAGDPQLVVQVVLHDPQRGHYGGQVAAPVFRDVMSFALKSLEIPPSGTEPAKLPLHPK